MATGAAAVAVTQDPNDPPVNITTPADREAWINLDPGRYMDLCHRAYLDGNFEYVRTALRATREGITSFITDRFASNNRQVAGEENFQMLQMQQEMNALLLNTTSRNARKLVTRVEYVEGQSDVQGATLKGNHEARRNH